MQGWKTALAGMLMLGACSDTIPQGSLTLPPDLPRFAMKPQSLGVARSNSDIARDFLDLTFGLENGDALPQLLKYEAPVRVALNNPSIAVYRPEIDGLLRRLRQEAKVDIALTNTPGEAQIFIEAIPRRFIQRVFPGAACFIIPGVRSWEEFRRPQGPVNMRWSLQETLGPTTVFIPSDSTPQDTRDCLHEEIAQALGPANDLFRIPETVFNDDNFHSILTPFDMLVLRALYQPELSSGMSAAQVALELPYILDRINPKGRGLAPKRASDDTKLWKSTITRAMDRNRSRSERRTAARTAIELGSAMQPTDHRLGLAVLTLGRLETRENPQKAAGLFETADTQFRNQFGPRNVRSAHVAIHRALLALRAGEPQQAVQIARAYQDVAEAAENAVVFSGLLAIEAEALRVMDQTSAAREARLKSLRWARYAFGDNDGTIAKAQAEIAAFKPDS